MLKQECEKYIQWCKEHNKKPSDVKSLQEYYKEVK